MQVDGISRDSSVGVVFAKDELRSLLVILFHFGTMVLSFLRQRMGCSSITIAVCLLRFRKAL
jgi:hypothetical protein